MPTDVVIQFSNYETIIQWLNILYIELGSYILLENAMLSALQKPGGDVVAPQKPAGNVDAPQKPGGNVEAHHQEQRFNDR